MGFVFSYCISFSRVSPELLEFLFSRFYLFYPRLLVLGLYIFCSSSSCVRPLLSSACCGVFRCPVSVATVPLCPCTQPVTAPAPAKALACCPGLKWIPRHFVSVSLPLCCGILYLINASWTESLLTLSAFWHLSPVLVTTLTVTF